MRFTRSSRVVSGHSHPPEEAVTLPARDYRDLPIMIRKSQEKSI